MTELVNLKTNKEQLIKKYNEILEVIEKVEKAADDKLAQKVSDSGSPIANINTWNDSSSINKINQNRNDTNTDCYRLKNQPVIMRVKTDNNKIYYFAIGGNSIYVENLTLINYNSQAPMARLASKSIGEEIEWKNEVFTIVEKEAITPSKKDVWDAIINDLTIEQRIPSIRNFINDIEIQVLSLDDIFNKDTYSKRNDILDSISLRHNPILDKFQDNIFRLPINQKLLILGAPGTGKTTTLIKRVASKISENGLTDDEQLSLKGRDINKWIMFTPNLLLKSYLKESFSKEGVATSDQNIKTWDELRKDLSREIIPILRTPTRKNGFKLEENINIIKDNDNFLKIWDNYQTAFFNKEILEKAKKISLTIPDNKDMISVLFKYIDIHKKKAEILSKEIKEQISRHTQYMLNIYKNRFSEDLIKSLKEIKDEELEELDVDDDGVDDEDEPISKTDIQKAILNYQKAIRMEAGAVANGKSGLSEKSSLFLLKEMCLKNKYWPTEAFIKEIAPKRKEQSAYSFLSKPLNKYFKGIVNRYRQFRKENTDYFMCDYDVKTISTEELDYLLLSILQYTQKVLKSSTTLKNLDMSYLKPLKDVYERFYTQVLVDEATDFSNIQLACMNAMTTPETGSFFACGDLNQRLTTIGIKDLKEINFISDILKIDSNYRQSQIMNKFSDEFLSLIGGEKYHTDSIKTEKHKGVYPILLENSSQDNTLNKLADFIIKIEKELEILPTIAIFVSANGDGEKIKNISSKLKSVLSEYSIDVLPCLDEGTLGGEANVRVFDIKRIKGLEFEASFILDIDELAKSEPSLYERYIYVGMTRVATYFGMTCQKSLPKRLESLRSSFRQDWSEE